MTSGRVPGTTEHSNSYVFQGLLIAVIAGGMFWLVWLYGNGLRDPRYLDGWILAGGMGLQLMLHIAIKTAVLSPKSIGALRKFHIFNGYVLIAAFISHSDYALPDTRFEWALWAGFMLVTLTGIFGTYLAWSLAAKRGIGERDAVDRVPERRAGLARSAHAAVTSATPVAAAAALPSPPYDAWILDLYTSHLRDFFLGPRNFTAHLMGSQRPVRRLTDEIDSLSRYVDKDAQEKLAAIKVLVIEKDRLDFAAVHHMLTKGWLFVHVPVTYALIVLTVLHVIVVYAFSPGTR